MESENLDIDNISYVDSSARIAILDDMKSSPRIIDIEPQPTIDFIGDLSSQIYKTSHEMGGKIAYSIIRQVSENLIHAYFNEIIVTIMPGGNTIKFSDQGPGIKDKEKAMQPGFSSATKEMKKYIHGVGAGLPIALEYLKSEDGTLVIEDNISSGTVITLSLDNKIEVSSSSTLIPTLSERSQSIVSFLELNDLSGVSDISKALNIPISSTHVELAKLEKNKIISCIGKKRTLTDYGREILKTL